MEITTVSFLVFVGVSLLIYQVLPTKYQWMLLLVDSVIFYVLNAPVYTLIYVLVTIVSIYFATMQFAKYDEQKNETKKKRLFVFVLLLNIAILVVLKYTNLILHTSNTLFKTEIADVKWIAPLAISYYTLSMISYLCDAYWGMFEVEKNIGKLALYTIYFPQMVSGPVNRYSDVGKKLFEEHRFDYERIKFALIRIAWGFVKKVVIAAKLALLVDEIFKTPSRFTGQYMWLGVFLFTFELYADFSGCMDIILGVSECFGITLPENFNAPFFARTIQEFWQRWHITLGTWLRDYIMNPILKSKGMISLGKKSKDLFGKKKGKKIPMYLSMLVLWLAMGLWHGNSWKYILGEGVWYWLVIVLSQILEPAFKKVNEILHINTKSKLHHAWQMLRTFVIFSVGMLFFRAADLPTAFMLLKNGFVISTASPIAIFAGFNLKNTMGGILGAALLPLGMLLMFYSDYLRYKGISYQQKLMESSAFKRWIFYFMIVTMAGISMFGYSGTFIYQGF